MTPFKLNVVVVVVVVVVNVCTICAHGDGAFCQIALTSCYTYVYLSYIVYRVLCRQEITISEISGCILFSGR